MATTPKAAAPTAPKAAPKAAAPTAPKAAAPKAPTAVVAAAPTAVAPPAPVAWKLTGDDTVSSVLLGRRNVGTVVASADGSGYVWFGIGGDKGEAPTRDEAAAHTAACAPPLAPATEKGRVSRRDTREAVLRRVTSLQLTVDAWTAARRKANGQAFHLETEGAAAAKLALEKAVLSRDAAAVDTSARPERRMSSRTRVRNSERRTRDVTRNADRARDRAETIGANLADAKETLATVRAEALRGGVSVAEIEDAISNRRSDKSAESEAYAAVLAELIAISRAGIEES